MLETIEKLLILQERDHDITQLEAELNGIPPQRRLLQAKAQTAKTDFEAKKLRLKQIESDRKELELEVAARQQSIEKYALQQFQTKRNEEYRALAHEIQLCKDQISKLEDQQLELMEQADVEQKALAVAGQLAEETRRETDDLLAALDARERELRQRLSELQAGRGALAEATAADGFLPRYERLRRGKGGRVVVGVEHGVCGGCHMKLPPQIVISCQGAQEVICCPNCGRLLYYTQGMDLAVAE